MLTWQTRCRSAVLATSRTRFVSHPLKWRRLGGNARVLHALAVALESARAPDCPQFKRGRERRG
eukprot:4971483-Alexandrium_andersonii.AAC.1